LKYSLRVFENSSPSRMSYWSGNSQRDLRVYSSQSSMGASLHWNSPPSIISLLSICLLSFSVKAVIFPDHDLSSLPKPEYDLYKKARMGRHQIVNMLRSTCRWDPTPRSA
jgi:hypothetical protein